MTEEQQIAKIKEWCLAKLEEERAEVVALLENTPIPDLSVGGGSFAAQYAFNQSLAVKLRRIDRALERNRQGLYGNCERCGTPMWERLQSLSYADLCIDCQRKIERNNSRYTYSLNWSSY